MNAVRELPLDKSLPSVGTALDPVMMRAIFQDHVIARSTLSGTYRVTNCRVNHIKYRAEKKCAVGYVLSVEDLVEGTEFELNYAGRAFPIGTSLARFQKAQKPRLSSPRLGPPLLHIPEMEMVIWAFPNDRKMMGIPRLMATAAHQNKTLDQMVARAFGDEWQIAAATYELVHYVPEHTCTTKVELALHRQDNRSTREVTLFGKCYYNDDAVETFGLMEELSSYCGSLAWGLRVAQPLMVDNEARILWQMGLPGRTMLAHQDHARYFPQLVAEAGMSVALLHQANLSTRTFAQRDDWRQQLGVTNDLVAKVQPHLSSRAGELVAHLLDAEQSLAEEPVALLHGDLHWQNFLVDETQPAGNRLALIDLDGLQRGSPWMDLGSFCAGLIYRALLDNPHGRSVQHSMDHAWTFIKPFLLGYQQSIGWPLDQRSIAWYTAAALINERIYRSISRLKPGRLALIGELLSAAEAVMHDANRFSLSQESIVSH